MRYWLKKILIWIGIFLVAFIAVGLLVRAVFNYTNGKKLEKFLGQMKSEKIPLTLKDLEPECVPRDNAALSWKTAEAMLSIPSEDRGFLGQVIDDLFSGKSLDEEKKAHIRNLIADNRDALDLILEASAKPCFKDEAQWEGPGYTPDTATAINMIQGTRLLGIDAVIKAEDGNIEEAIGQCLAARRLLIHYMQEPSLMSYLISMACMKQVAACFNSIVSDREIETETLRKILEEWGSSPWNEGLLWAIESEKTIGLETALLYLKGEYEYEFFNKAGKLFYWVFRPAFKTEIIWMARTYDRLQEVARMPYFTSRDSKEIEQITDSIPWYYKMMGVLIPNFSATLLKRATLEAMYDTARIGLACKVYKNLNGDFPEKLAELPPEILEKIPVDPFTGEPFIYKKDEEGFIVYSIGSNQRDDGGKGTWAITSMVMKKDDDWAWKVTSAKNEK